MKDLMRVMGALSRDMLFMHGHITSLQGLDVVTPPAFRRAGEKRAAKGRATDARERNRPLEASCC